MKYMWDYYEMKYMQGYFTFITPTVPSWWCSLPVLTTPERWIFCQINNNNVKFLRELDWPNVSLFTHIFSSECLFLQQNIPPWQWWALSLLSPCCSSTCIPTLNTETWPPICAVSNTKIYFVMSNMSAAGHRGQTTKEKRSDGEIFTYIR